MGADKTNRIIFKHGFTLIEMLTILTIITILSVIVFSVFLRVRQKSKDTVCQNNLKQLYLAVQQYVRDNDDVFPVASGGNKGELSWEYLILPYIKNTDVFICPISESVPIHYPVVEQLISEKFVSDYLYNFSVGRRRVPTKMPGHDAGVVTPSEVFLNVCFDSRWVNGHSVSVLGMPYCGSVGRPPEAFLRHFGGSNYSFVDGHIKWLKVEQASQLDCGKSLSH